MGITQSLTCETIWEVYEESRWLSLAEISFPFFHMPLEAHGSLYIKILKLSRPQREDWSSSNFTVLPAQSETLKHVPRLTEKKHNQMQIHFV